jgi:hypothetical protein
MRRRPPDGRLVINQTRELAEQPVPVLVGIEGGMPAHLMKGPGVGAAGVALALRDDVVIFGSGVLT